MLSWNQCGGHCIFCGAVGTVRKLKGVRRYGEAGCDVWFNKFKTLYHNWCQCNGAVVIQTGHNWLPCHWHTGGSRKHIGTTAWLKGLLKMSVSTSASTDLEHTLGMLSGPVTFRGLTLARIFHVSAVPLLRTLYTQAGYYLSVMDNVYMQPIFGIRSKFHFLKHSE